MDAASANTYIIIQARMGSSRLPGKVLKKINGIPALWYLIKRLQKVPYTKLFVATSTLAIDDQLSDFVDSMDNIYLFRGSHTDLVSRYHQCLASIKNHHPFDVVIRVCADNFMICPSVVIASIKLLLANHDLDIINPFLDKGLPFGCGAEVSRVSIIDQIYYNTRLGPQNFKEHLFFYAYNNPNIFTTSPLRDLRFDNNSKINISVDTHQDFERIKDWMECLGVNACLETDVDDIIKWFK